MEPMKNLLIKFPEKLLDDLANLAKQQGVPRAELIREWAECPLRIGSEKLQLLREHAREEGVLMPRIVGEAIDLYVQKKSLRSSGTPKIARSK